MKSQWQDWAREWGLTHHPQRGFMSRNEWMVGAYRGYLLRIGWGGEKNQDFIAMIRYPKVGDPTTIAQRMAADPATNTVKGWRNGRLGPELVGLAAGDTALVWKRRFAWRTPKAVQLREWVEALFSALKPIAAPFAGRCENCGSSASRFVLVEQVPTYLCESCQAQLIQTGQMAAADYEQLEANYLLGGIYAAVGAAVGGGVWALLAIWTNRMFALLAIGIAMLVAKAYQIGAKKIDMMGQVLAVILSLAGVFLGQLLFYASLVQKEDPRLGFKLEHGWSVFVYVLQHSPGDIVFAALCGLVGAYYSARMMAKPKFTPKIEQVEPPGA